MVATILLLITIGVFYLVTNLMKTKPLSGLIVAVVYVWISGTIISNLSTFLFI